MNTSLNWKIALITWASSGIGRATAYAFAKAGVHLILVSRSWAKLEGIKQNLTVKYSVNVHTSQCDVRDKDAVQKMVDELPHELRSVDILLNNAGLARGLEKIQDGKVEDWEEMIDTNVKWVLYVTRSILPLMISRKTGHIIIISSGAGRDVYVWGNVYHATKFAIEGLSKAIRMDLLDQHIKVSVIAPGMVDTDFHIVRVDWDVEKSRARLEWYHALSAEDVADSILYCASVPDHVNISEIVITPKAQAGTMIYKRA